jgi:beta-glucanase (GH16 family)
MQWDAKNITWYLDGKQTYQIATPADMHKPMYVLVQLAVGGKWPGSPDATTDWTKADLLVDYVRIYSLDDAAVPPPPTPIPTPIPTPTTPIPSESRAVTEIGSANATKPDHR